jgi:DNA-binding PadR family transcriptional regulator
MSIQSLEDAGEDPSSEAVVGKVGAGDIDPDEGTVEALLHRLVDSGCLEGGDAGGPYRLTALGRAALLDGSTARPSAAEDAADELASPATDT